MKRLCHTDPGSTSVPLLLAMAMLAVVLPGCASRWTAADAEVVEVITDRTDIARASAGREILKVYVDGTGIIHLDGVPVSLDTLHRDVDALGERGGIVWYYRDDPDEEPPPEVAESVDAVMQAVLDANVTVEMFEGGFDRPSDR